METKSLIDIVTAIGSVATPILVLMLTAVGWKYRQSMERKIKLEEKLRDDRIEIYNGILEPFIILFMSKVAWEKDKKNRGKNKDEIATGTMLSLDYRKLSFRLSLIGSDSVVLAFNNLMQHFYSQSEGAENVDESEVIKMMELVGVLLLEIRRSMGNEATKIDHWDMLEWFFTDTRKYRTTGVRA